MVTTEKRITLAQLACIIFILGMSLKMLVLPVLLIKSSNRDAFLGMVFITVMELICLGAMIAAIIISPDMSFTELIEKCVGKVVAKMFYVAIIILLFFKLLLLFGDVRVFVTENLFPESDWNILSLPLLALCAVVGMGSLRALGRMSQFLAPIIIVATVILFCIIGIGVDYSGILPVGGNGFGDALRDMVYHAMWYGDYSVLVVCLGALRRTKKTALVTLSAGVLASAVVLFFTLVLTASFGSVAEYVRFGQNVTGMSNLTLGNATSGRFDLALFCVWTLSILIKAGILSYGAVYFLRSLFPCPRWGASLGLCIVLYIVSLFCYSALGLHSFMLEYCSVIAFVVQTVIPVAALIFAIWGKRKGKKPAVSTLAKENGEGENCES